jgi:two-component system NtrC family sensor kinase
MPRRVEENWAQLSAELRGLLDAVQCGVLLLDMRGHVRHANACLADFLGLESPAAGTIKHFDDLERFVALRFRNPQAFSAPWKAFAQGSGSAVRDELAMAGPNRRVLARDAKPVLGEDGGPIGWLEIYRDITSQRQIQSKLLQTEKMAALGQLVSGIAHELNNPLTSIMGYAQLLLGRGAPEAHSGEAKMIFDEAERARRIVKNLLFFARKAEPERTRVDVNEIVERTVTLRGYELKIENIAVATDLAPDLPATLADPFQLQQVVLNLLVNAEQAILEGRGHGRIEIRTRKMSESRLAIEVSDDGPGIPAEIATRIFDPFFTTKAPGVGTGLGLSIVYGIVEQHGGEVAFENLRSGGVKFTAEFPILAIPAVAAGATAEVPARLPAQPSAVSVLVIEDEPTVAQLIADVLREEGHQVEAVLDSQEGLTRIARQRYDLIICDLRMPRLDGPAFYDTLVSAGSPARHRILFVTGDTLGPRTIDFLKSRQLPFLAKPFLVEELKLAVNRILQGRGNEERTPVTSTHTAR